MLSAQRALWRMSWRDSRRNRGRSTLVLAMVAIPVMLLVAGVTLAAVVTPSVEQSAAGHLGQAEALVYLPSEAALTGASLPEGVAAIPYRMTGFDVDHEGSLISGELLEVDLADPIATGMVGLVEGRLPAAPGEAVVTAELADRIEVHVGDVVAVDPTYPSMTAVGIVVDPEALSSMRVVVAPGTFGPDALAWNVLLDVPPHISIDEAVAGLGPDSNGYSGAEAYSTDSAVSTFGGGFVLTTVALFGTGLIISAAFAVGARRQLRTIGLVGAIGGEPAHIRRLVIAGGTLLGLLGAVLGTMVGLAGAWLLSRTSTFAGLFDRILDPFIVSPILVVGAIGLGTLAATLAAAVPARAAGRISTTEALAERMPQPRSASQLARLGVTLIVVGAGVMAVATIQRQFEIVALALVIMLVGFLAGIPLVVSWLGRIARRFPMEERIAARSTARHARRTGAALSAVVLALSLPVALGALTLSTEAQANANPAMAADQAVIGFNSTESEVPAETAHIAAAIPGSEVEVLEFAVVRPDPSDDSSAGFYGVWATGADVVDENGETYPGGTQVLVGDATTLRIMHGESGIPALESGKAVGLNIQPRDGFMQMELSLFLPQPDALGSPEADLAPALVEVPAVGVDLDYGAAGNFSYWVIPRELADQYGFQTAALSGALLRAPHDLTQSDLAAIAEAADSSGSWSYGLASTMRDDGPLRTVITAVSMAIALVIVAMTVALVAAESRREQSLLVALGTEPRSRRRIVGAGAAMLAALAALVAVPAGLVPVSVALVSRQAGYPIVVPWMTVGLVLIGVPLLAGFVAAVASRSTKTAMTMRQIA